MLNEVEKELMDLTVALTVKFYDVIEARRVEYDLEPHDADFVEVAAIIHNLQNWVLANAAADDYPSQYRFFGCRPLRDNDG